MPKRKARSPNIPDESPASKQCKRDSTRNQSKHGKEKVLGSSTSSAGPVARRKKLTRLSSNWKTLSKSLGIPCERKQDQTSNGVGDRVKKRKGEKKSGAGSSLCQKEHDIWFDDVPLEDINEGLAGEPSGRDTHTGSLVTGSDKSAGRQVGLDCEMVGTGADGSYSMVARVCLVNHHGNVLLDTFVAPMDRVTDYRTAISGVSPKDLRRAPGFRVVQKQVSDLLKDRILVGHSVQNDLKALLLSHPKRDNRDTLQYRPFKKIAKTRYPSLKKLAKEILGVDIQSKEHSPVEDARAAMKLYQLHRREWEVSVRARLTRREIRDRKRERRRREEESGKRGLQKWTAPLVEPFNVMLHTER